MVRQVPGDELQAVGAAMHLLGSSVYTAFIRHLYLLSQQSGIHRFITGP